MNITRIQARKLGGLVNQSLDELAPTLNIIYGPNEAGKTTLKQALRIALFPITPGTTENTYSEKGVTREVMLEFSDGARTYQVVRSATRPNSSNELEGTPESLAAFATLVGDVGFASYQKLFHIGPDDLARIEGRDISPLMAAQWGTALNPVDVARILQAKYDEYAGGAALKRPYSIAGLTSDIKTQDIRIAQAQQSYDQIDKYQQQLDSLLAQCKERERAIGQIRSVIEAIDDAGAHLAHEIQKRDFEVERHKAAQAQREETITSLEEELEDARIEYECSQESFRPRNMFVATVFGIGAAILVAVVVAFLTTNYLWAGASGAVVLLGMLVYDWYLSLQSYRSKLQSTSEVQQTHKQKIAKLETQLAPLLAQQEQDEEVSIHIADELNSCLDEIVRTYETPAGSEQETVQALRQLRTQYSQRIVAQEKQLAVIREEVGRLTAEIQHVKKQVIPQDAVAHRSELQAKLAYAQHQEALYRSALAILERAQESTSTNTTLLDEASRLFADMTHERYQRIVVDANEQLGIVNGQGDLYPPNKLSRGTADLLFLALRFGTLLARGRYGQHLPIVLDDTCVHMDEARFEVMCRVLGHLALRRQIFYFTCHQHIASQLERIASSMVPVRRIDRVPV